MLYGLIDNDPKNMPGTTSVTGFSKIICRDNISSKAVSTI